ncbi:phage tail protein [Paenibacillus sp. CC-CFT742]|nr:phage tail protein [Paenibacillus sp. CC-CFT742]WJH30963.1 phage tail protein [Paenibacillus sp. CC-CFT742]
MPQETDRLKLPLPLGNENVTRESINGIFEKIDAGVATQADLDTLREAVSKMDIPDASLTQKGKVQLSDATNSTVKDKAATPSAVKLAYDEATAAKQLGVEQKNNVVAALNSIGVTASTSESWAQLIPKITEVIRATGNATAADLLTGKTASNVNGTIAGSMPNRGAGGTVTPGTANQTKAAGYYSSAITVLGDANLVQANIKQGVTIFGKVGTALPGITPGDTPLFSFTGTNMNKWPAADVWTTFYRLTFAHAGKYRISYKLQTSGGVSSVRYRSNLFTNGIAISTERVSSSDTSAIIYTADLEINAGQVVDFMGQNNFGSMAMTMSDIYVRSAIAFTGQVI